MSPEVRPVTVEDFRAGSDVLDGPDDDPGPVKAEKNKKVEKLINLKLKNKKLFYCWTLVLVNLQASCSSSVMQLFIISPLCSPSHIRMIVHATMPVRMEYSSLSLGSTLLHHTFDLKQRCMENVKLSSDVNKSPIDANVMVALIDTPVNDALIDAHLLMKN